VVRETGPAATALRSEAVPPPPPGPGQVVLAVEACGVCFHDIVAHNGALKAGPARPFNPSHEICGACRHGTQGREPLRAKAVFIGDAGLNGGYAAHVALDAGMVAPMPDGVAPEAAPAASAIGTLFQAVREIGRVGPGDPVPVTDAEGELGVHGVRLAGARERFDERRRRVGTPLVIAQWQNGVPVTILPRESAMAQPVWPRR